jgi:hypothetical protein
MADMEFHAQILESDYESARLHLLRRNRGLWLVLALMGGVVACSSLVTTAGAPFALRTFLLVLHLGTWLVLSAAAMGILHFLGRMSRGGGRICGDHAFTVSDEGIFERNSGGTATYAWSYLKRLDETATHFFVVSRNDTFMIIPKRCLDCVQALAFGAEVRRRMEAHAGRT